jgi:hypothetical protein
MTSTVRQNSIDFSTPEEVENNQAQVPRTDPYHSQH